MKESLFENKVAIVTGAGSGIGYEIANQLVGKGAQVIINDIDSDLAKSAASNIQHTGPGKCIALSGDSSDSSCIKKMITTAVTHFGRVDMIVANSGVTTFGNFLDYTEENFQRLIAVNLKGTFFLIQKAAQQMIHQKSGGRILIMSSVVGNQTHPNLAAYGMTKAALQMLAKSLGVELGKYKIGVNAIAPGATLTERTLEDPEYKATWNKLTPGGRAATTTDIANASLFLLSSQSEHITGQTLVIDGGWSAVSPPPE